MQGNKGIREQGDKGSRGKRGTRGREEYGRIYYKPIFRLTQLAILRARAIPKEPKERTLNRFYFYSYCIIIYPYIILSSINNCS